MILFSPLSPLEDLLRNVLEWFHGTIGLPWAWAIVAVTVCVRLLMVPLAVKQIHSMQAMQAHMPEMKSIQQRFKHDKQKRNEELMKFYRDNNVNPAAPCLPLLVQFPVFIALYLVLRQFSKNPPGGDLSWFGSLVPDITAHANAHWSGYLLLAIYVGSQLASTYFMSTTMDKTQRTMMMVLPSRVRPGARELPGRARHLLGDDEPVDGRPGAGHAQAGPEEAAACAETLLAHAAEGGGRRRQGRRRGEAHGREAGGSCTAAAREAQEEGQAMKTLRVKCSRCVPTMGGAR